ncbi:unnamed protein product, partial [Brachionus calyciflorus]
MDGNVIGTPITNQPTPNGDLKTKKFRNAEAMDKSPEIEEIDPEEFERIRNSVSKMVNLQLKIEQQDATIRQLTDQLNELISRLEGREKTGCSCRCNSQNFVSEISKEVKEQEGGITNNNYSYKTAVMKSIRGKTNEPIPPQRPSEINVVNSIMVEQRERESKNKNVIIYGVELSKEEKGEDRKQFDINQIGELLDVLKIKKGVVKRIIRFKNKVNDESRVPPILVELNSVKDRNEVLAAAKGLHKQNAKYKRIYLNADLTEAERVFEKQLREEKSRLNETEGNLSDYEWKIIRGRIVRVKKLRVSDDHEMEQGTEQSEVDKDRQSQFGSRDLTRPI